MLGIVVGGSVSRAVTVRWAGPPGIPIAPPSPAAPGSGGGSETWPRDQAPSGKFVSGLAVYKGLLYTGNAASGAAATVQVRSNLGAWTTSDTDPDGSTGALNAYTHFIVYQDELYASLVQLSTTGLVIRKFDGSSWTTAYDVHANQADVRNPAAALVFKDKLYWVMGGTSATDSLVLENDAGSWSEVETGIAFRGFIATLEVGSGI